MPDVRSSKDVLDLLPITDLKYEVEINASYGFRVNLNWTYGSLNPKVIGFKVYKTILSKNLLNKKFSISQKTLEATTFSPNPKATANILYDKSAFLQTDKVKIENSNSDSYNKVESESLFQSITFVNYNKNFSVVDYSFVDKNVKFGESYSYYVTAVSDSLKETIPVPINVNVEFLKHPQPPDHLSSSETNQGILLVFGNKTKANISEYLIFRKISGEENFVLLDVVDSNFQFTYYTDLSIEPKVLYVYRVYSKDIWGNVSLDSKETERSFSYTPRFTSKFNEPVVNFEPYSDGMSIKIETDNPKIKSVRIERRDDWRFEKGFEIKSFDEVPWQNNYMFVGSSLQRSVLFVDKGFELNRVYSYKFTCFDLFGHALNYFIKPYISRDDMFEKKSLKSSVLSRSKISFFKFEPVNRSQKEVFVKFSWSVVGNWSYILVNNGEREFKIENIHSKVFLNGFSAGKKYQISASLFDDKGNKTDSMDNMELKL
jgi:hypothetical protein